MNRLTLLTLIILSFNCIYGATYHIDPAITQNGDGSAGNPFQSWNDLPDMQTGDDVYFKCGTLYAPTASLNISWNGTESNPAIIGAYYLEDGKPVYGSPEQKQRPIISGSDYTVPSNDCYGSTNSWEGLIRVYCKDYVHIQDLHLYSSGNRGIEIIGNLDAKTNSAHFHINNVFINGAYGIGILIDKNRECYGIVENCEVVGTSYSYHAGCYSNWGVSLVVFGSPYSHVIIRNNRVHENWGEGIGSGRVGCTGNTNHSGYVTIEDNIVWNNRRVDIYPTRTEGNIVRRNICLGTGSSTKFGGSWCNDRPWNQAGIWINVENRGDCSDSSHDNLVYNNLVAGHYSGITIGTAYESGTMENNRFYNNTVVGNYYNFRTSLAKRLENYTTNNLVFQNNVFYCPPGTDCSNIDTDHSWFDSKIDASYNVWTNGIPPNVGDTSDVLIKTSDLINSFNWQNIKESDIDLIVEKFRELLQETDALDQGVVLDSIFTDDYFNLPRSSDTIGWDAGAFEYGIEEPQYDSIWSCCVDKNDYSQITTDNNIYIKKQQGLNLRIYPNPTTAKLNISGVESGTQIQVINTVGTILRDVRVQGNSEVISLAGLPPGIYLVIIKNENKIFGRFKAIKS